MKDRQTAGPLKSAREHVRPARVFVTAMFPKAHSGPPSQASRRPAVHRSPMGLLRRQALSPGERDHEFLRDKAHTLFVHHVPKTRAVTANVGDVDQALCEYIGTLFSEAHALTTRPRALRRTQRSRGDFVGRFHMSQQILEVVLALEILRCRVDGVSHYQWSHHLGE